MAVTCGLVAAQEGGGLRPDPEALWGQQLQPGPRPLSPLPPPPISQPRTPSPSSTPPSALRSQLHGLPHVAPFRTLLETPTAAYATRQHLFANLYDRLSTRPFLTGLEKRCGEGVLRG